MYRTLLVFDNYYLLKELQELEVWGVCSEFEITTVLRDGQSAYQEMKHNHYDLIITEIRITGLDGLELLRLVREEKLCNHVVLCSEFSDFDYARQGIILGAFDYLVKPFQEDIVFEIFNRIKNEGFKKLETEIYYGEEILNCFRERNNEIYTYLPKMLEAIYNQNGNFLGADKSVRKIYETVIDGVYDENEWLDLYIAQHDFYTLDEIHEGRLDSYKNFYGKKIIKLYELYCELFPKVNNDQIKKVIVYILNNPESELKQKDLAARLYMNASYFSTVFGTHTNLRFVDYLLNVRLYRAAYLLQQSPLKIVEIAQRLNYKDTGYFSHLFKKKFGVTPSEYKMKEENLELGGFF
ncbi:helix-turn-helix domain-containing protein [bacterium 210820-DFI.6.37]|nr:helix-turn-helix domain-containing protein [bacterium 210820-DFI.6.37]